MSYIPTSLRQFVTERAKGCCEYCLYPQYASLLSFEMEHIISEKHKGETIAANLALACPYCNRAKGTDLGSIDPVTGVLTPSFNPRTQGWIDHFCLVEACIKAFTPEGRVTVEILQFNDTRRLAERKRLITTGMNSMPEP
ncbi:MAG: HNH endonuclease signature motif containing protein [Cyanobacteria bacterium P01_A01_bin.37]